MNPYTILVEFQLKAGAVDEFLKLVVANAESSLRTEPGCLRFDVLRPKGQGDRVALYEIYDSAASFAVHCDTPHINVFNRASQGLVVEKTVTEFETVHG